MKIAIIGASGKTGLELVRESLQRDYEVVAVCRQASGGKLMEFAGSDLLTVVTPEVVSDEATLTRALMGCDAVAVVMISVRELKASTLVKSLAKATAANGVKRLVFTAGEITVEPEEGEETTRRQRLMLPFFTALTWLTPFSLTDVRHASATVRKQSDWGWTIVRAPTLNDKPPKGYRLCELSEVTTKHALSRKDYAACMLDSLDKPEHNRRSLTVVSA